MVALYRRQQQAAHFVIICVLLLHGGSIVSADTPANCTYEDVVGQWTFYTTAMGYDNTLNCSAMPQSMFKGNYGLKLYFPSKAVDQHGNQGFWTLIYNQGFEVVIQGRKFFAFSRYEGKEPNTTSVCSETMRGMSHNVVGRSWACFYGMKQKKTNPKKLNTSAPKSKLLTSKMLYNSIIPPGY
ncbi:dipeptidyl peptidase 1-like [Lingula anatina]|uniref:Dipeptidyl peptidase 1-like n=1 Tax=Lingula anatina TaxID=7574 RepID=A0A1S3HDV9_LINAN|nr:dipeptidyl peptidase 1-like [Lingula anatina]|eukprot:XP_013384215.1 dipeptidyl peptidase 1-like [Lingula anatina]